MKTLIKNLDDLVPWLGLALGYGLLFAMLLTAGCARFETTQTDASVDNGTNSTRNIITKATASTFIAGKTALANWKANQSDKSQGASVGSLTQEATGAETIKAVTELLKTAKPVPVP